MPRAPSPADRVRKAADQCGRGRAEAQIDRGGRDAGGDRTGLGEELERAEHAARRSAGGTFGRQHVPAEQAQGEADAEDETGDNESEQ